MTSPKPVAGKGAFQDSGVVKSVASMDWNPTGSWKYLEPFYEDWFAPCSHACPAGNDIVTWLRFVEEGRYQEAARSLLNFNPFPATLGCVCPHPCETPCNRKALGGAIAIQSVERFLGEYAIEHDVMPELETSGSGRVVIAGAGPAALSAAYFLRLRGYDVTVLDRPAGPQTGLLSIPAFRLPRRIVEAEYDRLRRIGIKFEESGPDAPRAPFSLNGHSAGLVANLAEPETEAIEGLHHPAVLDLVRLLDMTRHGSGLPSGRRLAIAGSRNDALDLARSLVREGHEVTVFCRDAKADASFSKEDLALAAEEGVRVEFLTAVCRILFDGDRLQGLICARTRNVAGPVYGRAPIRIVGTEFTFEVDHLVTSLPSPKNGSPFVDASTGLAPVFECPDSLDSASLGSAVSNGRKVAAEIHAHLSGAAQPAMTPVELRGVGEEIAKFKDFNEAYFRIDPGPSRMWRDRGERLRDFDDVRLTLSEPAIRREGSRCFKCGTCTLCGNCELFCPDNSIVLATDGSRYEIRQQYCKGCMVCVEECPRAAIHSRRAGVSVETR